MTYLQEKSLEFAVSILRLSNQLTKKQEYIISKQIARSATSIGANLSESSGASSVKDMINKQFISLKECKETRYWLRIIERMEYVEIDQVIKLSKDCEHIHFMLNKSIVSLKSKL